MVPKTLADLLPLLQEDVAIKTFEKVVGIGYDPAQYTLHLHSKDGYGEAYVACPPGFVVNREAMGSGLAQTAYGNAYASASWASQTGTLFFFVRVENGTPEKDGTKKIYWLRVPPMGAHSRPKSAIAWTYGRPRYEFDVTLRT